MELIAFVNPTAGFLTQSWTADDDYTLRGASGGSSVISKNPTRTWTNTFTSPVGGITDEFFITGNTDLSSLDFDFPISKGEKIYCAHTNAIETTWLILDRKTAE
jgi:hypothetical protein